MSTTPLAVDNKAQRQHSTEQGSFWDEERIALLVAVALGVVAAIILRMLEHPFDVDDAPITYRYAQNLADGLGYVYNASEYVQGTSTPLYTLILAMLALVGIAPEWSSWAINLLASGGVVTLVFLTTFRVAPNRWLAGVLAVVWLMLQGSFLRFATAGMETPFYMLLIAGALYALAIGRLTWATVLAALALLTRLDGAAIGAAVFASIWLQTRRFPLKFGILYAVIVLPWFAWAWWYFGHPLPNSMRAKQLHLEAIDTPRDWILREFFALENVDNRWPVAFALPGLAQVYGRMRTVSWLVAPVLWLVLYFCAYIVVGIDYYEWYLSPIFPVLAPLVGTGFAALWTLLVAPLDNAPLRPALRTALAAALFVGTIWYLGAMQFVETQKSVEVWDLYLENVEGNRILKGQWLRDNVDPASVVASGAIGHVGYESGLHVIDSAGLITPDGYGNIEDADYLSYGETPIEAGCGTLAEFLSDPTSADAYPGVLSACDSTPIARVGPLEVVRWRIADRIYHGVLKPYSSLPPSLEMQWMVADPAAAAALDENWQVWVHLVDSAGETIAQADHALGREWDGYIAPAAQWDTSGLVYTYALLPENWPEIADKVESFRIGLWNPATGERMTFVDAVPEVDINGALVLPLANLTPDQRFTEAKPQED